MNDLQRVNLLSESEAMRVRDDVFALRGSWIRRHDTLPSFTLGAASYLDARQSGCARYLTMASRFNPVLSERFHDVHERVRTELGSLVGESVSFDDHLALPGFHVFLADKAFEQPVSDVHFDLQYQWLDWSRHGEVEPRTQLSFTLPLRIPQGGAGLTVWKSEWTAVAALPPAERAARIRETTEQIEERYEVGVMVIHTGHWLHRISPGGDLRPGDERVTLQGHAIRTGTGWIAYW